MNLRDKIIYKLEKERGNFISGQDLAIEFGVSRNAISKCINALREDGFLIESIQAFQVINIIHHNYRLTRISR